MTLLRQPSGTETGGKNAWSFLATTRAKFLVLGVAVMAALLVWQWEPFFEWLNPGSLVRSMWWSAERFLPLNLAMAVMLFLTLALERVRPIYRTSETGGRGLSEDLVWFVMAVPATVIVTFWFNRGLTWLFENPLKGVGVNLSDVLPYSVVFVFCFVLGDFLGWFSHYLKHKVPLFWRFHTVHHSAIDLSPFTDARVHYFEYFVNQLVVALPFFFLGGNVTKAVTFVVLFRLSQARFNHSNVKTHLGPFGRVIVSPQYHRLHHSAEPRDVDKNFGGFFTIWDHLFGTVAEDLDRYTKYGIENPDFPTARSPMPTASLGAYFRQLAYPFRSQATRVPTGRAHASS